MNQNMEKKQEEIKEETLDEVFLTRSKIGKYFSIPEDKREIMMEYFKKNPYPKKDELIMLSQITSIDKSKIQNWFKYQRQKDYRNEKMMIKTYKSNRKFTREGKKLLELYFRKSHQLSENALNKLSSLLKCERSQIERWFYYRNKKLNSLLSQQKSNNDSNETFEKESVKIEDTKKNNNMDILKTEFEEIKKEDSFNNMKPIIFPNFSLPPPPPCLMNQFWNYNDNSQNFNINDFLIQKNEYLQKSFLSLLEKNVQKEKELLNLKKEEEFTVKEENEMVKIEVKKESSI